MLTRLRKALAVEVGSIRDVEAGKISYAAHTRVFKKLAGVMENIAESADILPMILAERMILDYDLNECSPRKFAEDAKKKATQELDEMEEMALEIAEDVRLFHRAMSIGTRAMDHRRGLPIDGMRKLIALQKVRLKNLYSGRNKEPEAN